MKLFFIFIFSIFQISFQYLSILKNQDDYQSEQCNYNGYFYHEQCYCFLQFQGKNCNEKRVNGKFSTQDSCYYFVERLDHLLNINEKHYQLDDNEFPRLTGNSIGDKKASYGQYDKAWIKMHDIAQSFKIFGPMISPLSINQGSLGNCYMLATLASLSNIHNGEFIKNSFVTKIDNEQHIYVTRWFIEGKPRFVAVDEWIPKQGFLPAFSNIFQGKDEFWAIILEKSWAKIFGGYLNVQYGFGIKVVEALTAARGFYHNFVEQSADKIYLDIQKKIHKQYPIMASTYSDKKSQNNNEVRKINLVQQHSYSVLDAYEVQTQDKSHYKVIKIFNPWNEETWLDNPWGSSSSVWTSDMRRKYKININDGIFHISPQDFKDQFIDIEWSELQLNYEIEWLDLPYKNDNNQYQINFAFNSPKKRPFYVFINQIQKNLISKSKKQNCQKPFSVKQNSFEITDPDGKIHQNDKFENEIKITESIFGNYSIKFELVKHSNFLKYFTISTYAPKYSILFDEINDNNKKDEENQCQNNCNGNGICNTYNGQCKCYHGWTGSDCSKKQKYSCPHNCKGNGKCDKSTGICHCFKGYLGSDCSSCQDLTKDCKDDESQGFCYKMSSYNKNMWDNCRKTCGEMGYYQFHKCYVEKSKQNPVVKVIQQIYKKKKNDQQYLTDKCLEMNCGLYGKCQNNKCECLIGFEGELCQKRINDECKDILPQSQCLKFLLRNYCNNENLKYMAENCADTCQFCKKI